MHNSVPSPSHRKDIAGVPCDFISREYFLKYISHCISQSTTSLTHIVTLNAEMVVEAQKNDVFRAILQNTELNIPDGASMLWAKEYAEKRMSLIQFFFSSKQPLTGVDSMRDVCEILHTVHGIVYLIGGKEDERKKAQHVLQEQFPNLDVLEHDEHIVLQNTPNASRPSAAFVALGAPKQTLWIEERQSALQQSGIRIAMGVGGAFAMLSGHLPRAPRLFRRFHLEWLWRLLLEPKRIKRIWNAVIIFPRIISGYPH